MRSFAALISKLNYWGDDAEEEATRVIAMCGASGPEALGQNPRKHCAAHRRHVQLDLSEPGRSRHGDPDITRYRKWEAIRKALVVQAAEPPAPI